VIASNIATALENLGCTGGYAANEVDGIVLWENDEPQPTEAELIAAGWVKQEETPTE
jgi:hypothetical protein